MTRSERVTTKTEELSPIKRTSGTFEFEERDGRFFIPESVMAEFRQFTLRDRAIAETLRSAMDASNQQQFELVKDRRMWWDRLLGELGLSKDRPWHYDADKGEVHPASIHVLEDEDEGEDDHPTPVM